MCRPMFYVRLCIQVQIERLDHSNNHQPDRLPVTLLTQPAKYLPTYLPNYLPT